jgi:DNA invertase Pin-like site-specific DNA recombinase
MASGGYARVSSVGQTLDVQLGKLKECDKIFKEKYSGASGKRPRLQSCHSKTTSCAVALLCDPVLPLTTW